MKYDSLHVLGKHVPEDTGSVVTREGYTLPLGKIVKRKSENSDDGYSRFGGLDYSEYVVKDETKVVVRFILKIGTGKDSSEHFEATDNGSMDEYDSDDEDHSSGSTDSS